MRYCCMFEIMTIHMHKLFKISGIVNRQPWNRLNSYAAHSVVWARRKQNGVQIMSWHYSVYPGTLVGRNSALCCSRRSAISHVEVARAGSGTCTFRLSRAPGRTKSHASPARPDRHVHTSACIINVMHAQWRIQVFLVARKLPPVTIFLNLPRSVIILMHCQCCT